MTKDSTPAVTTDLMNKIQMAILAGTSKADFGPLTPAQSAFWDRLAADTAKIIAAGGMVMMVSEMPDFVMAKGM